MFGPDLKPGLLTQSLIKSAKESSSSSENKSAVNKVGSKFGWAAF